MPTHHEYVIHNNSGLEEKGIIIYSYSIVVDHRLDDRAINLKIVLSIIFLEEKEIINILSLWKLYLLICVWIFDRSNF